jgi:hypothetical protein
MLLRGAQPHGDFVLHIFVFMKLVAGQVSLEMQKQMEIAGSEVRAVSRMVATFTAVIFSTLPTRSFSLISV